MFYENVTIKREEKRVVVCCDVKVSDDYGLSDEFVFECDKEDDMLRLKELLLSIVEDIC